MPDITGPNATAYGTYEAALAQMLSGGGPIAGPLNQLALRSYANQSRGQYGQDLQRTQLMQQRQAQQEMAIEREKIAAGLVGPGIQYGATGYLDPYLQDAGINVNAEAGANRDAIVGSGEMADALKANASAGALMANAGYFPAEEDVNNMLMPQDNFSQYNLPELEAYMTPDAKNDQTRAAASMKSAEASMVGATRPRGGGGGGGGGTSYTIVPSPFPGMAPQITIRTKDSGMANQYLPGAPANAVEQSGGAASATARLEALLRGD